MVDPGRLINILMGATAVLPAVLVARLVFSGLARVYPWFAAYMLATAAETGLLLAVENRPILVYTSIWTVFGLVNILLEAKVVLTIFGQWTKSFPGIGAFGRKLLVMLMLIAAGVAASTIPVGWPNGVWMEVVKLATISIRAVNIGFSLFLLLTLIFFWKFGGPVAPNLRRHSWAMAAYVTATSVSYFVATGKAVWLGNILLPAVTLTALIFWVVALQASGEVQPDTTGEEAQWEEAEEMNRQMQKLADAITLSPGGVKKDK